MAEVLVGLVYVNAVKPGHPAIFGTWPFVSDLRTGAMSGGSGEQALLAELAGRGVLPTGLALDQQVLDRLLQGDASEGAPPLETLVLNARDAAARYGSALEAAEALEAGLHGEVTEATLKGLVDDVLKSA